ncbi:conserved hypothetical protein [Roseovarius sp. EC-HK134]|nr:conserved hypothetical protein [Roseovarius sp. EC-SD190]VVT05698.1 conserved hypothetical protein [Roseovarius sp. EC-HK134]
MLFTNRGFWNVEKDRSLFLAAMIKDAFADEPGHKAANST